MVEAQIIGQGTASDIQAMHPVQTQDSQSSKRPFRLAVRGMSDERSQPAQRKTCYRCGSVNHTANYDGCPAKDAQGNSCRERGHLAKVCRGSKQVQEVTVPDVNVLSTPARHTLRIVSSCQGTQTQTDGWMVKQRKQLVYMQCQNAFKPQAILKLMLTSDFSHT